MSAHKMTIEENFDKLEAAVGKLEDPDISLEEAFENRSGTIAMNARKSEPISVIREIIFAIKSVVGLPGLIPGIVPLF